MLDELLGYQIIDLNENGFAVRKGNVIKHFVFFEDEGDCCGFNELSTALLINRENTADNPFISSVEYKRHTNDYADEDDLTITFFGGDKALATIDSLSSSGSGWCYGACVKVVCVETDEEEILTEW